MATSTRDARRRRIVERGEDRLALITGRIQTLDSSPLPSPSQQLPPPPQRSQTLQPQPQEQEEAKPQYHHAHTFSSPPLLSRLDQTRHNRRDRSFVAPDDDDEADPVRISDTSNDTPSAAATDSEDQPEPHLRKCETNVDTIRSPPLDDSSLISSTVEDASRITPDIKPIEDSSRITPHDTKPLSHAEPRPHHPKLFTAKRFSSAIKASENSRILCSITIALLVVLSHLSLPIVSSSIIMSFLTSWPLYLVLLGNFTIVLAQVLYGKQRGSQKAVEKARKAPPQEPNNTNAMDVGKAIEIGLLTYKAFRAAFMDCSVYTVVVVCGLSLLPHSS